jgi:hypothetical protein
MFDPFSLTRIELAKSRRLDQAASVDDVWAFIRLKSVPADVVTVSLHEASELPADRTFRNAWTHDGSRVTVDMPKARVLHMDHIRRARQPVLDQLDKDWMKATGQRKSAEADAIEAQRQVLRDIPQTLDLTQAATPDELKALWPVELPRTGA